MPEHSSYGLAGKDWLAPRIGSGDLQAALDVLPSLLGIERAQMSTKSDPLLELPKVDGIEFLVQLCTNYLTRKRVDDAVGFLKQALAIDPENKVLPKQIWALQHPEKFYSGPIDKEWQKQQPPVI